MENKQTFTKESPAAIRSAATTVGIKPTENNVILKIVGKSNTSGILVSDKTEAKDIWKPEFIEVAGYGEMTYGFEIGDRVIMNSNGRAGQPIYVKDNKYSLYDFMKRAKGLVGANGQGVSKQDIIVEYTIVSMFDIIAVDYNKYESDN